MAEAVKYEGTPVKLGGREFILPPLNLKLLKKFLPAMGRLAALSESDAVMLSETDINDMVEVVLAALQRNYPELTSDELEEVLDIPAIPAVFRSLTSISGVETGKAAGAAAQP